MVTELENMPGVDAAAAKLAALDAAEATATTSPTQEQREATGERAAQVEEQGQNPKTEEQTDTRAAAEQAPPDTAQTDSTIPKADANAPAKPEQPKDEKGRFQKAIERGFTNWKEFNEWKAAETQKVEARTKELEAKAAEIERKRVEVEEAQPNYQPEDYEQAAANSVNKAQSLSLQADGLEKRAGEAATAAEERQLQEQAAKLRKQAAAAEVQADNLKDYAANLRKNPPANAQQREAKRQQQVRDWSVAAAREYPELLNLESAVYKEADKQMAELKQRSPELASHPSSVYYVARMAKLTTEAARVPGLDKELGQLRARVQELEGLATTGGGGAVQPAGSGREASFGELTEAEQMRVLRAQAQGVGTMIH